GNRINRQLIEMSHQTHQCSCGIITDLTGFGDYAAGTLMRLMGHFDKLAIDTVARKAYEYVTGHAPDSDTDIRRYYDDFGKWRGLVLWMDCIRDEVDIAPQPIAE
ncbi:MAG: hypothetical protein AAFV93_25845, partial [Chloroflexota bacterium]